MKKLLLILAVFTTSIISVNAQSKTSDGVVFGGGVNLGLPTGNFGTYWSLGIGVKLQAEKMFTDQISGVGSIGYADFFGKSYGDGTGNAPSVGLIPILVGARFYPSENFFVGIQLGYGVFTNTGSSSGNSGLDYFPQVGYNADKFQVALGYNGVSVTGGSLNHLDLSFIYKFNSGK